MDTYPPEQLAQMALTAIHQVLDAETASTYVRIEAAHTMRRQLADDVYNFAHFDVCLRYVDQVMSTARITTTDGGVTDDSRLLVDAAEHPIPHRTDMPSGWQSRMAPHRIVAAIRAAGYRKAGGFWQVSPEFCEVPVVRQLPTT